MNSISNISIFPEINSTSIWQTLVDNVLNGIAYLFAAILSTRARKIETAPVGVLQNTSAIETVLDIYGNAILRLAYSYLHNMSDAEDILQDTLIKYMQSSPAFLTESHKKVWLLHVAANLSKNKIDYNKIRETDELEETLVAEERERSVLCMGSSKSIARKIQKSASPLLSGRLSHQRDQ